jgi:serine phosphatase RsbU (regulator of sigma subunit)
VLLFFIFKTGPQPQFFSDSIAWFLIFINIFTISAGWIYFRSLNRKFQDENKKLSEKLSDRSYNVMIQKWDLERRNISISQQNQEILESLHYAKTIQSAILPKADLIYSIFKDGFVFYKPKDIVSGDFYFLERSENLIYLAVADCTGHGVAGAFMSMVGTSLLKQIILQGKHRDPAAILQELNEGIVDALRQKETFSHGGMDIALCVFDLEHNRLEFAGANRPLILIRRFEMESIRPDKLPIGGFFPEENRKFSKQVLNIEKGDRIYLYSDGYADQFGGTDGKKIMTRKFKDLILSIHDSPMRSQEQTLENFFENWRGRYEQVDDVLVLGIQV